MRHSIVFVVAVLVVALAIPAVPAEAKGHPTLLTKETAAVTAGGSSWVVITWQGMGDVSNVRVTAKANKRTVGVGYPENTGDHSSLMVDSALLAGEIDFAAFRLEVPYSQTKEFRLQLQMTYEDQGKTRSRSYGVRVPVVQHTGADLAVAGETLGTARPGEATWVGVKLTGLAPSLADVEVTVDGGLPVVYPGDGDHTSLHHDSTLLSGETDVARFRVDPEAEDTGVHDLQIVVSYTKGRDAGTETVTLPLEVGG